MSSISPRVFDQLSQKHQKVIRELNLLKGNINMVNESLDHAKTRNDLRQNTTLVYLLKALEGICPSLESKMKDVDNDDVMACCKLVKNDLQATLIRFN